MNTGDRLLGGRPYKAYLLRLWQENQDGRWRVTIEDPQSHTRKAFSTLDGFIQYLKDVTESAGTQSTGMISTLMGGK